MESAGADHRDANASNLLASTSPATAFLKPPKLDRGAISELPSRWPPVRRNNASSSSSSSTETGIGLIRVRCDMADTVLYELRGHVATITYNRPESLNAVNGELRRDLNAALRPPPGRGGGLGRVVTGAGRAFCAGADLARRAGHGRVPWTREALRSNSFESGWEIHNPVIAAVNGHCLGYGLTLVTWCDFVLASDRGTFGYPEVRLGIPAMVGAIRLPRASCGPTPWSSSSPASLVDAERARQTGLAWRVVAHDGLLDEADAWRAPGGGGTRPSGP